MVEFKIFHHMIRKIHAGRSTKEHQLFFLIWHTAEPWPTKPRRWLWALMGRPLFEAMFFKTDSLPMMILDSCFFFLGWLPPPLGFYTAIWWSTSMMSIAKKNRNLYRVVIYVARQTNGFVQRGGILTLDCQGNPNFVSWFGRLPAKRLCVTRMHLFTKVFTHYPKTEHLWSCEWYGKKNMCYHVLAIM